MPDVHQAGGVDDDVGALGRRQHAVVVRDVSLDDRHLGTPWGTNQEAELSGKLKIRKVKRITMWWFITWKKKKSWKMKVMCYSWQSVRPRMGSLGVGWVLWLQGASGASNVFGDTEWTPKQSRGFPPPPTKASRTLIPDIIHATLTGERHFLMDSFSLCGEPTFKHGEVTGQHNTHMQYPADTDGRWWQAHRKRMRVRHPGEDLCALTMQHRQRFGLYLKQIWQASLI